MRRIDLAAIAATLVLGGVPVAGAASGVLAFNGLFEGVDPDDGSLTQRQITCTVDGACEVLGSDTYFSLCAGSDGRGLLRGDGTVRDGVLEVEEFTLTCADGRSVTVSATFTLDPRTGTLFDEPDDPSISPVTLHRINSPLRQRR